MQSDGLDDTGYGHDDDGALGEMAESPEVRQPVPGVYGRKNDEDECNKSTQPC